MSSINNTRLIAAVLPLLLRLSCLHAVEVPSRVEDRSAVVVTHSVGADIWVFADGFAAPKWIYRDDDTLLFGGNPGKYVVFGKEDGKSFQYVVTIGGDAVDPNPPGPVTPDPPKPNPIDPDKPPEFEKTQYDVGPQVAWLFTWGKVADKKMRAASIFDVASTRADRVEMALDDIAQRIAAELSVAVPQAVITQYGKLMEKRFDEGRCVTMQDHAKAWKEVAAWLKK